MEHSKVLVLSDGRELPLPDPLEVRAVADWFRVFGDPTRTRILWLLNQMELNVGDIARALDMTKSAVSHQLHSLREVNLVRKRKVGREVFYSLADDHVKQIFEKAVEHLHE